jgi:diguanylate cyclase (GGDEF)-like protein
MEGTSEFYLELITDTLRQLDPATQGSFLKRFLRSLVNMDINPEESIHHWEEILHRRDVISASLGRPVSIRTATVDYFGELGLIRSPIIVEYEELKRLRHNAATDPLTGLYNRRLFDEYLEREMNRAERYGSTFALLILDLRSFKHVNDTLGHAVGDQVLVNVAETITEAIRGSDFACRIGGDEFAVLISQSDRTNAEALAQRIVNKFEAYAAQAVPDSGVGLDFGVAAYPEDGKDLASFFAVADRQMYSHKQRAYQEKSAPAETPPPPAPVPPLEPNNFTKGTEQKPASGSEGSAKADLPAAPTSPEPKVTLPSPRISGPEMRRYERVPLEGARSLGFVRVGLKSRVVRVLDLSFGGVSLLVDENFALPEVFPAQLHVPILPASEFTLYSVHTQIRGDGKRKIGCSFTPISKPKQILPD